MRRRTGPGSRSFAPFGGDLERLAAPVGSQPGTRGATGGVAPEGERVRLFDEVGRFLAAASGEEPILVTLDDVHAADEPSLLLLRFLGQALSSSRESCSWRRTGTRRIASASGPRSLRSSLGWASECRSAASRQRTSRATSEFVTGSKPTSPGRHEALRGHVGQPVLRRGDRAAACRRRDARGPPGTCERPIPPHPGGDPCPDSPARGGALARSGERLSGSPLSSAANSISISCSTRVD